VALCVARFYEDLADRLEAGARAALEEAGVAAIERFDVPGAFELPVVAKYAAGSGRVVGVVCLGAVVRGESGPYHFFCGVAARGRAGARRWSSRPGSLAGSACSPSTTWSRRSLAYREGPSATAAVTLPRLCSRRLR